MDVNHLSEVMALCKQRGEPIVMVVCTAGTTDAFAIDPIAKVRKIIDAYENCEGYGKPFLYADAVIGWSWMAFKKYNFKTNPLGFSKRGLEVIKKNYLQIKHLSLADAIGIDFHKTGWSPLNSTFFLTKDYRQFTEQLSRPLPPYLQFLTDYNPFIFTLETTKSCSNALMGWAALKFFGYEGFQVMLGRIVEVTIYLRSLLEKEKSIVCINPANFGFVTLFRVYPKGIDAKEQYDKELHSYAAQEELAFHNNLQELIANKLFNMLRNVNEQVQGWENPPYTSFTKGARAVAYSLNKKQQQHDEIEDNLISALKAFPMSPFSNEISMLLLRNYVLKARDIVMGKLTEQISIKDLPEQIEGNYLKRKKLRGNSHNKLIAIIKEAPVFSHLNAEAISALIEKSHVMKVKKGSLIFHEGQKADNVYIIITGKVSVLKKLDKNRTGNLATLKRGDVFGEMAVFENSKRSATIKAITNGTFLVIDGSDFVHSVL